MIALELRFLTGKLHATPWGRQVNEGAVEWPPSPWRLLRALLSVSHNKFPDQPEENVESLIQQLAVPPSYRLPATSHGHTRHYMPTDKKPAKIFDTFLVLPKREPVIVCWPNVDVDDEQKALLSQLAAGLGYLGRAESWVEATLVEEWNGECNARPLNGAGVAPDERLERLLAPTPHDEYHAWRRASIEDRGKDLLNKKIEKAREKGKDPTKVKLTAGDWTKLAATIPESVFQALHAETNDLRKAGWNRPPGSRWVEYVRPVKVSTARRSVRTAHKTMLPTVARYAVTGKVVPRLTDALRIGERARQFLMGCSKRANKDAGGKEHTSAVFSGKNNDGSPLKNENGHQHAHFLCEASATALAVRGRITHLTVYAPMGFQPFDEAAIARFTRTWGDEGHDLQFVLLGIGQPCDFGGTDERAGQSAILATSKHWISRTPLVLNRHLKLKRSEKEAPDAIKRELIDTVRFELSNRTPFADLAASATIEPMIGSDSGTMLGGTRTPWLKFVRERKKSGGSRAGSRGYGFRISFDKEVTGPIALGYGCHFGLGQFVPDVGAQPNSDSERG